jgi:competence protein ComEA
MPLHKDVSSAISAPSAPAPESFCLSGFWFSLRFPLRSLRLCVECVFLFGSGAAGAWAQNAEVPGKAEAARICIQCHEYERSIAPRQNRAGWQATMDKMVALGAKGTQKEFDAIVDYLATTYPGEEVPKIKVNQARAIELESGLSLPRSQAAAIIEYRSRHGDFKSIEDLKKVPGVDVAKIEARKDRLLF